MKWLVRNGKHTCNYILAGALEIIMVKKFFGRLSFFRNERKTSIMYEMCSHTGYGAKKKKRKKEKTSDGGIFVHLSNIFPF